MRRVLAMLMLLATIVPMAHARRLHVRIEGPAADGLTYTVRTAPLDERVPLEPWALAEGVIDGKHHSVLLRLQSTERHGEYRFTRAWPREGRWTIRMCPGNPAIPTTVALLRPDGGIERQTFHRHTDGFKECLKVLDFRSDEDC